MKSFTTILIALPLLFLCSKGFAQSDTIPTQKLQILEVAPQFHKTRFWALSGIGLSSYAAVTVGLDRAWYANYPRSSFHFFDDWKGWRQMDKFGHAMTGYFESKWAGQLYRWAGLPPKKAAWVGLGTGLVFQSTLEILDGFSSNWGFSWGDMAFNALGSGLYCGQELLWQQQRIRLKMSTHKPHYSSSLIYATNSNATSSIQARTTDLFGSSAPELLFKEYNGQTIWLSLNIASFLKQKPKFWPVWLNIATGYGIENIFGAERNSWTDQDGNHFEVSSTAYPRYTQFYLSLDIDFERIPTKHRWLKTIFSFLNVFKVPFPTLEVNTLGKARFHAIYF